MNWKQQLTELKQAHLKCEFPAAYEASGGDTMKMKPWRDDTANGLTTAICDWLNYSGYSATRINTTGTMRKINGQMRWTCGNTRLGTADVHAIIKGRHVSIEVKIGRDRMSEHQHREKARVEAAGGLYIVATDMPGFLEQLNKILQLWTA